VRIKIEEYNTEELEKEIKSRQPDRYRLRLQTILLAKRGMNHGEIQKTLLISKHAFYTWIHQYTDKTQKLCGYGWILNQWKSSF